MILKKAVISEQCKNNELNDLLKTNEQNNRRLKQEVESLEFRNQQLSKRISVLQVDLEQKNSPNSRKKLSFLFGTNSIENKTRAGSNVSSTGNSSNSPDIDLIDEINMELKVKTEENEKLKDLVVDLEQKRVTDTEQMEQSLNSTINELTEELNKMKQDMKLLSANLSTIKLEKCNTDKKYLDSQKELQEIRANMDNVYVIRFVSFIFQCLNFGFFFYNRKFENKNLKSRLQNFEQLFLSKQQQNMKSAVSEQVNHSAIIVECKPSSIPILFSSQQYKSYQDLTIRQNVIREFTTRLVELICALSTLHMNVSQKISIMFALFNKNSNHLFFLDLSANSSEVLELDDADIGPNRSVMIKTILRKVIN